MGDGVGVGQVELPRRAAEAEERDGGNPNVPLGRVDERLERGGGSKRLGSEKKKELKELGT